MAAHDVSGGLTARRMVLGPGAEVMTEDGPARVLSLSMSRDGVLQALLDHGDHRSRVPWVELAKIALSARPAPPEDAFAASPAPMLAELPDDARQRIERRFRDLLQIETGSLRGNPEGDRQAGLLAPAYDPLVTTRPERVKSKAAELRTRGEKPWAASSLYRQLEALRLGPDALIHDNRRLLSDRLVGMDPLVLETIRTTLKEQKNLGHVSQRKLLARIRSDLDRQSAGTELTRHQLAVLVGELSRGDGLHHDAKARRSHGNKPVAVYGLLRASRPGEYVQIDATPTNIHIWDGGTGTVPAVILTAIDVYTRNFLALRVLAGAATSRDVAMLLSDMGRPTITRCGSPYELRTWHGIPRLVSLNDDPDGEKTTAAKVIGAKPAVRPSTIVLDHGSENASDHLMAAAAENDITVIFCPPRAPHAKGIVESSHHVIDAVQSIQPAYKGANVLNRPDGAEDQALLTAQDLHDILWTYILEIYQYESHDGLRRDHQSDHDLTPAGVFQDFIVQGGTVEAPTDPFGFITFYSRERCLLQDYGVNVARRVYNSAELQDLRRLMQAGVGVRARPLTVYYDRWDVSRAFTRHPLTREWMCLPRATGRDSSARPYSELLTREALRNHVNGRHRPLSPGELHAREAELIARWSEGLYQDRREAKLAAIEVSRQRDLARDIDDAGPEFRKLAFGDEDDPSVDEPTVYNTARDDDALFDYDEIEPEELAL